MFKKQDVIKGKLSQISAKTLSLGGKQYVLGRNEQKIKYSTAFEYAPLSHATAFRLLRIKPGADTDVISVDLLEANLDDNPSFEALSYTWDLDPKIVASNYSIEIVEDVKREERPIKCNGDTLHITMNLYNALIEFRRMKLETSIWADQVCINQQDIEEKIAQLAIMTQIYRSASTVVVWLGTLNLTRSWALDFMEALPDEPVRTVKTIAHQPPHRSMLGKFNRPLEAVTSVSNSLGNNARWLATLTVLGRQWFRRIWTLQELLLANRFKIVMGNREIPQSAIVKAATQAFDFFASDSLSVQVGFNFTLSPMKGAVEHRAKLFEERIKYQSGKRYTAEEYLIVVRRRHATVHKDRVFAGAALLEQGVPKSVTYSSTTRDIYCAYASERLWPQTGIKSLGLVGGALSNVEGLPSWVPDLSTRLRPQPLRSCGCPTLQSPIIPDPQNFRIDGGTLHVMATKLTVVRQVGESVWSWDDFGVNAYNSDPLYKMNTSSTAIQERFGLMFAMLDDIGTTYAPTGERSIDAFWKTLIGGAASTGEEDLAVWQNRFYHYFAFKYLDIRSTLKDQSSDTWKVSLIQDRPRMEQRVSHFLETHDQQIRDGGVPDKPLKKVISAFANRIWGADTEEEAKGWKGTFGEMLAAGNGEDLYRPVSMFGDLFGIVYDGRRIFSTENGFLGISTEGVKVGDVVCLIAGADVPYVLRPVAGTEADFTLVGEAYLHGLMSRDNFSEDKFAFGAIQIV